MLEGKKVDPEKIYIIGGPAAALSKVMAGNINIVVPKNFDVANAIGAALARTTFETELFADTGKGKMVIPNLGIEEKFLSNTVSVMRRAILYPIQKNT